MYTDQYLNFRSNHPTEHKRSVVRTLYHRAELLVSDEQQKAEEMNHIREALCVNDYAGWILKTPEKRTTRTTGASQTKHKKKLLSACHILKDYQNICNSPSNNIMSVYTINPPTLSFQLSSIPKISQTPPNVWE